MDDDSSSGGEMVSINDVFDTMSASSSPPTMTRPSIIVPVKSKSLKYFLNKILVKYFSHEEENVKLEPSLQKGGNDFLYVESKRARLEREKV